MQANLQNPQNIWPTKYTTCEKKCFTALPYNDTIQNKAQGMHILTRKPFTCGDTKNAIIIKKRHEENQSLGNT